MTKMLNLLTALFSINSFVLPLSYHSNITQNNNANQQEPQILNLDDYLVQALYADYKLHHPSVFIRSLNVTNKNLTYTNINASLKNNTLTNFNNGPEPGVYFGKATFTNPTNVTQTFLTPEFSQKVTNSYSCKTVTGISGGISTSFKYLDFNFKFNYSTTDVNTNSTTITITSPSQTVKVPPKTITEATVLLSETKGAAEVNLDEDINGTIKCEINKINGVGIIYEANIGQAFKSLATLSGLPSSVTIKDDNTIHFNGLGKVDGIATKSNYFVETKDTPIQ